jgi:hypothetical protein
MPLTASKRANLKVVRLADMPVSLGALVYQQTGEALDRLATDVVPIIFVSWVQPKLLARTIP